MPNSKKSIKRRASASAKKARALKPVKAAASRAHRPGDARSPSSSKRTVSRRPAASATPTTRFYGVRESSKLGTVIAMLHQKGGTTIEAMCRATGWQSHSVRGALSGTIKKKLGLNLQSVKTDGVRTYHITD